MIERYLGGGQTPLIRGLLRAAVMRSRFDGHVDFEFNDTDSAGVVPSKGGDSARVEVVSAASKREWLPLSWELPFYGLPEDSVRRLRISHPYPLIIAGVKIGSLLDAELLLSEFEREVTWVERCCMEGEVNVWLDKKAIAERVNALQKQARAIIQTAVTLGDFWLALGRYLLGRRIEDIDIVSFAHDFWRLTPDNAGEERFLLLDAFLRESDRLMNFYAKVRGVDEYDASRLPFFVVYEKEGWWIREELRRGHDTPKDVKALVDYVCQNGVD